MIRGFIGFVFISMHLYIAWADSDWGAARTVTAADAQKGASAIISTSTATSGGPLNLGAIGTGNLEKAAQLNREARLLQRLDHNIVRSKMYEKFARIRRKPSATQGLAGTSIVDEVHVRNGSERLLKYRESKLSEKLGTALSQRYKLAAAARPIQNSMSKKEFEAAKQQSLQAKKDGHRLLMKSGDSSSFVNQKPVWNTHGRRVQIFFGAGLLYQLVRGFKCPTRTRHLIFRPLQEGEVLNNQGSHGVLFHEKIQPALPVKNAAIRGIRYEGGVVIYGANGTSFNITAALDAKRRKLTLKSVPHQITHLQNDFKELRGYLDKADGEVPKGYIPTEQIEDLLGPDRNTFEQRYDWELMGGSASAVKDRWWLEFAIGIYSSYIKGHAKRFHMLGPIFVMRVDYEILKQMRVGCMYEYRRLKKEIKGFEKIRGSKHIMTVTMRFLLP